MPAPARSQRLPEAPPVRLDDSALLVLGDSSQEMLWAIGGDCSVVDALQRMARTNRGALLVMNPSHVVGLITRSDIKRKGGSPGWDARVADVMTDAVHVPIVGWKTFLHANVGDLLSLFESTATNHLIVVQSEGAAFARVRGLVYRRQMLRRLGVFPILDRGMDLALGKIPVNSLAANRVPEFLKSAAPR